MHLAAIVESREHVCCRYRVRGFQPLLAQAGHSLTIYPRPRTTTGWLRLAHQLRQTDGVILQRKVLPVWQLRLLRGRTRFLVYDFDDAIVWRHSSFKGALPSRRRQRLFGAAVRLSDAVVAGNSWLAEQARIWRTAERLRVIPTCVDPGLYLLAEHTRVGPGVELAWIGSSSTLHTLTGAKDILALLADSRPEMRLKVICDRFPQMPLPVVPCPWSEAGEAAALASADIGLSWLPNELWYRGKCGLKVLQYMAAGLPVVASPVGIQAELIRHGETGFLAEGPSEWVAAIQRLADDPALRQRLGRAGRRLVEEKYSVRQGAQEWLAILEELHSARRSGTRRSWAPVFSPSKLLGLSYRSTQAIEAPDVLPS